MGLRNIWMVPKANCGSKKLIQDSGFLAHHRHINVPKIKICINGYPDTKLI